MISCFRTRVRKQPIIALYLEFENELKLYNLEAWFLIEHLKYILSLESIKEKFINTPYLRNQSYFIHLIKSFSLRESMIKMKSEYPFNILQVHLQNYFDLIYQFQ